MAKEDVVRFVIDGREVEAERDRMLLPVALENGYDIPYACYHEAVSPAGVCGLCVVEVSKDDKTRMVMSCKYPVEEGIEVATDTDKVRNARRKALSLLLARAPGSERIQKMARAAGVEEVRADVKQYDDCILCGLCERVCREVVGANAITFVRSEGPPKADPSACIACGACVYICPTDCIKMEEHEDERTIVRWGRTLKLKECQSCGKPFAPLFQLNWMIEKAKLPQDYFEVCPICRQRR
jgi:predicted molibdopterin-dependent oxidoreductase YjgC